MSCAWYNFWKDDIPFVDGSYSYTHMEHYFCSTVGSFSHGYTWPAGRYCIFRKGGSCPSGFTQGVVKLDNKGDNKESGPLPAGVFNANTELYFCCRSDGTESTAISLPLGHEFMLMRHMSAEKCQAVEGGVSCCRLEFFLIRDCICL
jgi:CUB/sushi domain-containing protein